MTRQFSPFHVLAAPILAALLLLSVSCNASAGEVWRSGRHLQIGVGGYQTVSAFSFLDGDDAYHIEPSEPGNVLLALNVTIVNPRSGFAPLLIDEQAAHVEDTNGNEFLPVDPWQPDEGTQPESGDGGRYLPLLWGPVELLEGQQVKGWMFFEIPEQATLRSLQWEQGDFILVPAPE